MAYERDPGVPARIHLDGLGRVPDLLANLVADGVRITQATPHIPTLEDLYFAVRREARGDGLAPVTRGVVPASTEQRGFAAPNKTVVSR